MLVSIFVTSPDTHSERRLDSGLTIQQLKDKLTPITGISPQHQILRLYRSAESKEAIALLDDESRTLESYGVAEFNCIKVDNTDPHARAGEWNDTSAVDKFELSKEEYEARNGKSANFGADADTVLSHLKANKLGRFADVPEPLSFAPPPPSSAPSDVIVGARCEVAATASDLARRGVIRFVGEADIGKGGVWVGVELDEPTGKGDGSVNGKTFFTCRPSHAVFIRPDKITVGDFPEEDLFDDEDEV